MKLLQDTISRLTRALTDIKTIASSRRIITINKQKGNEDKRYTGFSQNGICRLTRARTDIRNQTIRSCMNDDTTRRLVVAYHEGDCL